MPQVLTPPIYGASRGILTAKYSTQFTGDNQIVLPLYGSFQGDPVQAISLFVDNYNNGIPIQYLVGGETDYVAAYTSEYIDVTNMDTIILTATDSVALNLAVYNAPVSGGRSRGLPPNGDSDPMFSNVLGLWHFDANNGATIAIDSKNAGLFINGTNNAPLISTGDSLYGGSSGFAPGDAQYSNEQFTEIFSSDSFPALPYTFEVAVKAKTWNVGSNLICSWTSDSAGTRFNAMDCLCYRYDATSNKFRFELNRVFNRINGTPTFQAIAATPFLYDSSAATTWHRLAVTTIGGMSLFVDGVLVANVPTVQANPLSGSVDLFWDAQFVNPALPTPSMYIDEMRLTLGTRYNMNYTPATGPFPSQ